VGEWVWRDNGVIFPFKLLLLLLSSYLTFSTQPGGSGVASGVKKGFFVFCKSPFSHHHTVYHTSSFSRWIKSTTSFRSKITPSASPCVPACGNFIDVPVGFVHVIGAIPQTLFFLTISRSDFPSKMAQGLVVLTFVTTSTERVVLSLPMTLNKLIFSVSRIRFSPSEPVPRMSLFITLHAPSKE